MYTSLIRPILFALSRNDAEEAHLLALRVIKTLQKVPPIISLIAWWYEANRNPRPYNMCGITFPNRIGLAAGFDKNAEMLPMMQALGFGFVEVGTILPRPQVGNPRPRLFRLPEHEALINRFGFNSDGMAEVHRHLNEVRLRVSIPIWLSMGKMKETPNEDAVNDYIKVWKKLRHFVTLGVANISSPNTPGLRELQGGRYVEYFVRALVQAEAAEAKLWNLPHKPIFVKIAPDLNNSELDEVIEACEQGGASGIIMGNTTLTRPLAGKLPEAAAQAGGLSGKPLYPLTLERFRYARRKTDLPMVFVGALDRPSRVEEALEHGANLVQLMTGFIYHGPRLVTQARRVCDH